MNPHEYQGKQLFAEYGLPVSKDFTVDTPEEAAEVCDKVGDSEWVVKAQVHAGGRGKAGGMRLMKGKEDAEAFAQQQLGKGLVTYQTDANSQPVSRILVESYTDIDKELYLGAAADRSSRRIVFMASTEGGVDVEKATYDTPEKILKITIDPLISAWLCQDCGLTFQLSLKGNRIKQFTHIFVDLAKLFQDYDLALLEVNPLVIKKDGNLYCLDARINTDNNTLYRQLKLRAIHDPSQDNAREAHTQKWELNYVALESNIGCVVSGTGLAMGTMDIVNLRGGEPTNFLDVGDGATKGRMTEAFKIILSDSSVKTVLVNVLGGIVRCDMIAKGIISAVKEVGMKVPVIVRLEDNNVELDAKVLAESGLNIIAAASPTDAAQQAVRAAEGE